MPQINFRKSIINGNLFTEFSSFKFNCVCRLPCHGISKPAPKRIVWTQWNQSHLIPGYASVNKSFIFSGIFLHAQGASRSQCIVKKYVLSKLDWKLVSVIFSFLFVMRFRTVEKLDRKLMSQFDDLNSRESNLYEKLLSSFGNNCE